MKRPSRTPRERSPIVAAYFYRRIGRGPETRKRWRHLWRQVKRRLDIYYLEWESRTGPQIHK